MCTNFPSTTLQAQIDSATQKLDAESRALSAAKQELTACRAQLERTDTEARAGAQRLAQSSRTADSLQVKSRARFSMEKIKC